jgi:hypothetical protein
MAMRKRYIEEGEFAGFIQDDKLFSQVKISSTNLPRTV